MIDYEDFNSQHENEAKQMVMEELQYRLQELGLGIGGEVNDVLEWCIAAAMNEWICHPDGTMDHVVGTLLSGSRITTFVNTTLCEAYLLCIGYDLDEGEFTGDDVCCSDPSEERIERLLVKLKSSPVRANPMKQSVGRVGAEFLRVSYTPEGGIGYVARAISSTVSGNWTVE
jgi:hypothetical protein